MRQKRAAPVEKKDCEQHGLSANLSGRLWPVTDLAETWCGDSGHPKNSLETHIFAFGPTVRDLEGIFQKNLKFVFWL